MASAVPDRQAKSSFSKSDVVCPKFVQRVSTSRNGAVDTFQRGKILGRGGFAAVFEVQRTSDGKKFALKVVSKQSIEKPRARMKLKTEIAIHQTLQHPHIARFLAAWDDATNVYILLELCAGPTLADVVKSQGRLSESTAVRYMYQILDALQYLHASRVIHRDLKLSNLFTDAEGNIKVGDFGLACQLQYDGERKNTICGTPNYIAPEILTGGQGHSYEVDIWSLGVLIYAMVVGRPPFETTDVKKTYRRIKANAYEFPPDKPLSPEARSLIQSVLTLDPRLRPTLSDIANSPWMRKFRHPAQLVPKWAALPAASSSSATTAFYHSHSQGGALPASTSSSSFAPAPHATRLARPDLSPASKGRPLDAIPEGAAPSVGARPTSVPSYAPSVSLAGSASTRLTTAADAGAVDTASSRPRVVDRLPEGPARMPVSRVVAAGSYAALAGYGRAPEEALRPGRPYRHAQPLGSPKDGNKENVAPDWPLGRARPVSAPMGAVSGAGAGVAQEAAGSLWATGGAARDPLAPLRGDAPGMRRVAEAWGVAGHQKGATSPAPSVASCGGDAAGPLVGAGAGGDSGGVGAEGARTTQAAAPSAGPGAAACREQPWVVRWVDYSTKYGLGYLLSDGTVGVVFNDSSRIALPPGRQAVCYWERRGNGASCDPPARVLPLSEPLPDERDLNKKATLLWHFEKYLFRKDARGLVHAARAAGAGGAEAELVGQAPAGPASPVTGASLHMKKWLRTKHATIFRLSDRAIQVEFEDGTSLVLTGDGTSVVSVSKGGVVSLLPLAALPDDPHLLKRLTYTREVLQQLTSPPSKQP